MMEMTRLLQTQPMQLRRRSKLRYVHQLQLQEARPELPMSVVCATCSSWLCPSGATEVPARLKCGLETGRSPCARPVMQWLLPQAVAADGSDSSEAEESQQQQQPRKRRKRRGKLLLSY